MEVASNLAQRTNAAKSQQGVYSRLKKYWYVYFALSAPTLSPSTPTTITSKHNTAVPLKVAIFHCQDSAFLASIFGNPCCANRTAAAAAATVCLWQCTVRSSAQEAQPDSLGTLRASWPRGMLTVEVMKGHIRLGELPRLAVQVCNNDLRKISDAICIDVDVYV